jgi:hypothetical protein
MLPVVEGGEVRPAPVAKIWITVPRAAAFDGPLTELSWLSTVAPPTPLPVSVNGAGAEEITGTPQVPEVTPFEVT